MCIEKEKVKKEKVYLISKFGQTQYADILFLIAFLFFFFFFFDILIATISKNKEVRVMYIFS